MVSVRLSELGVGIGRLEKEMSENGRSWRSMFLGLKIEMCGGKRFMGLGLVAELIMVWEMGHA